MLINESNKCILRASNRLLLADKNHEFCLNFSSRCQGIINKPRDFRKKK